MSQSHSTGDQSFGSPIGSEEFVRTQVHATATEHASLFQRIPAIRDLQSTWLLLLIAQFPEPISNSGW